MAKDFSREHLSLLDKIKKNGNIPSHVAIIMDGNGRWARKRGLPRAAGHRKGVSTVREIVEIAAELGVNYLTLYTFSTENWKRPKDEVSTLMKLMVKSLKAEAADLNKNQISLGHIGDDSALPGIVLKELKEAEELTGNNRKMRLNLALSYSGRWDIAKACRQLASICVEGRISPNDIDEDLIQNHLATNKMPDPDLLIRSGGEFRVSNFLLWQIAYAEIHVTDVLWPDFTKSDFLKAVNDYQSRERRFGLVSEQISQTPKNEER